MNRCSQAGCGGTIADGYCDTCGLAPAMSAPAPAVAQPVAGISTRLTTSTHASRVSRGSRRSSMFALGAGLVDIADVVSGDPAAAVLANPAVAEDKRYCGNCGESVGRSRNGQVGREHGFCAKCRNPFDFRPKLVVGEVVAGQYEVAGAIAHGGLGWIYLARDRNVSMRWVVLKGRLDAGSEDARTNALDERTALARLEHPQVVRIYNFVSHGGADYIVMEYVGGESLKSVLKARQRTTGGYEPLPVATAIAYMLGILPALSYLHDRGFVYCDFKPDNVMHEGATLKLIDVGGVRRIDDLDGAIYGTVGFQAPEIAVSGPSIASDLYTVGRTLAVLALDFAGYTNKLVHQLPDAADHAVLRAHPSFHWLLLRACAADPAARFQSVEELTEQLNGVLREIVSVTDGRQVGTASTLFGPDRLNFMGAGQGITVQPDWRHLPVPHPDDRDPAAALLVQIGMSAPTPEARAKALDGLPETPEVSRAKSMAAVEVGRFGAARQLIASVSGAEPDSWRTMWSKAVVELADPSGDRSVASAAFAQIAQVLPGELAPKVALALTHEVSGRPHDAAGWYDLVSRVDASYPSAAFGLARVRALSGDRAGAIDAYGRVPADSSLADEASRDRVVASVATNAATPSGSDVATALSQLDRLTLDIGQAAELRCTVYESALALVGTAEHQAVGLDERELRQRLEAAYRELARLRPADRIRLVDLANRVRPRTWW